MGESQDEVDQFRDDAKGFTQEGVSISSWLPILINAIMLICSCSSLFVAGNALFVALDSNAIARESNEIAEDARSVAETQVAVAGGPILEVTYRVAESIDLQSARDRAFSERLGLSPVILKTEAWRQAVSLDNGDYGPTHLFIFITNYGPGVAKSVSFSGEWVATEGVPDPEGWLKTEGSPRSLGPGSFLAMYLADLQGYDPTLSLDEQELPFREIRLNIIYQDVIGGDYTIETKIPGAAPAQMTP